jgi:subtilase family serine protease
MKKILFLMIAFLLITGTMTVYAQTIVAPPSTTLRTPGVPHTHLFIYIPEGGPQPSIPNGETPASLACVYGLVPPTSGCPKSGSVLPTGGTKAIAVVEFGLYANAQSDFNIYNAQWGLPPAMITQICYPAPPCPNNAGSGWDVETALDVQMAHAMAPGAAIYIAGFTNDPLGDGAEQGIATLLKNTYGAGEVSNSFTYNGGEGWCSPPSNCELGFDSVFTEPGIVYFAAAGDAGAQVNYPCVSPNVVCAGGTHINRSGGNFTGTEACWSGSGGGLSVVEPRPSYQNINNVKTKVGNFRGIPDMSADADPNSGVAVYNSTSCGGWCVVGGTSVASPLLAGYVNAAGNFRASTNAELTQTYIFDSLTALGYWYNPNPYPPYPPFFDITGGRSTSGWDQCTGIGSPRKVSFF